MEKETERPHPRPEAAPGITVARKRKNRKLKNVVDRHKCCTKKNDERIAHFKRSLVGAVKAREENRRLYFP